MKFKFSDISWKAVFAGQMVDLIPSILLIFLFSAIMLGPVSAHHPEFKPQTAEFNQAMMEAIYSNVVMLALLSLLLSGFSIFGGYFTALCAEKNEMPNAIVGGIVSVLVSILVIIAIVSGDTSQDTSPALLQYLPWTLVGIPLYVAGGLLFIKHRKSV